MKSLDRLTLEEAARQYRAGRTDAALELAEGCLARSDVVRADAVIVIGEALRVADRFAELGEHLDRFAAFRGDPRFDILSARHVLRIGDVAKARDILLRLRDQANDAKCRRAASFDLVRLYDSEGDYAKAWRIAVEEHVRSTRTYPIEMLEQGLAVTVAAAGTEGRLTVRRASRQVDRVAFLAGVPRSGTSLLEQMLDRHTSISGIGENALPGKMADAIAADGRCWPSGAQSVPTHVLDQWQKRYLVMVREENGVPEGRWSIDKTVFPMFQPLALACVLPGARVIRIVRDAADTAVSVFLSNMDPSWGWTGSMESIQRLITAERNCVKPIMDSLGVSHCEIRYESLVANPLEAIVSISELLDLAFEPACLRPEENSRVVMTLSNEQVRKPIHRQAIGRWKNYEPFMTDNIMRNFETMKKAEEAAPTF